MEKKLKKTEATAATCTLLCTSAPIVYIAVMQMSFSSCAICTNREVYSEMILPGELLLEKTQNNKQVSQFSGTVFLLDQMLFHFGCSATYQVRK